MAIAGSRHWRAGEAMMMMMRLLMPVV